MSGDFVNRLKRSLTLDKDTGWIFGVCAGAANYWHTDVAVVRVGVVIAALFIPKIVIATYLVAWLVLDDRSVSRD